MNHAKCERWIVGPTATTRDETARTDGEARGEADRAAEDEADVFDVERFVSMIPTERPPVLPPSR